MERSHPPVPGGHARLTGTPEQIIDGPAVRLRPLRTADADAVALACSDPVSRRFLPALPDPYTRADALGWITTAVPAVWAAGGAVYAIADPASDALLGSVGLDRVISQRGQAEVGYWVGPWARRRGVATAAVRAVSAWAFARGFGRLELLADWENVASQRVALAAGFHREGVRRAALSGPPLRDDRRAYRPVGTGDAGPPRWDAVAFSRLAGDPDQRVPRLLPDLPDGALSDGRTTLRPLRSGDADFLHSLHSLPDVVAGTVPPLPPRRAETCLRCAQSSARWLAGERADLVVVDAASGTAAGELVLHYQEPHTGQAMIGYCTLPEWRGHGHMTRAVRLVARWAFGMVGIARIVAGTDPANTASRRVLERVGFQYEGCLRSRHPGVGGGRTDDILYALLPADLPVVSG